MASPAPRARPGRAPLQRWRGGSCLAAAAASLVLSLAAVTALGETHSDLPLARAAAPAVVLPDDANVEIAALDTTAKAIAGALSCACFEAGELRIDKARSLADASCTCAYAGRVRADVADVAKGASADERRSPEALALRVETELLSRSPDYERLLRYDEERYRFFLENVRCVCEGCKATVYFSNCQLTCTPAIVYKRRARVFLAMGISVDGLIDFYLAEHNATHPPREQVDRAFLLPRKQKQRGWLVPAVAILGTALVLALVLRRVIGRSARREAQVLADAASSEGAPAASGAGITDAERDELASALEDLELGRGP